MDNSTDFFRIINDLMTINSDLLEAISDNKHLFRNTLTLWYFVCKYSPHANYLPLELVIMIKDCI